MSSFKCIQFFQRKDRPVAIRLLNSFPHPELSLTLLLSLTWAGTQSPSLYLITHTHTLTHTLTHAYAHSLFIHLTQSSDHAVRKFVLLLSEPSSVIDWNDEKCFFLTRSIRSFNSRDKNAAKNQFRKIQLSLKIQYVEFDITVPPLTIHWKSNVKNKNEAL